MRSMKPISMGVLVVVLLAAGWLMRGFVAGDAAPASKLAPHASLGSGAAPKVFIAKARETSMVPPLKYVGHVEAIQEVEIYARIAGTIKEVHFKEGALVNQGDLLFTIDPERYKANVDLYQATLEQTKASLVAAQAILESVEAQLSYADSYHKRLKSAGPRSVVQADVDKAQSEVRRYKAVEREARAKIAQLKAQVQQSEANLQVARIDLGYTEVRAPITGRIGKAEVTVGDYVSPGAVMMARVVKVDPVRVRFSMSDRDYLDLLKISKREGINAIKATLILPNGDHFKGTGTLDFVGNLMDLKTGTIVLRLRYDNASRELVPNSYVKVMVETPGTGRAVAIPQEAISTDQKGEYVYVVDPKSMIERRELKLGDSLKGERIVISGLKPGESVVIKGLQYVRPGQRVEAVGAKAKPSGKDAQS